MQCIPTFSTTSDAFAAFGLVGDLAALRYNGNWVLNGAFLAAECVLAAAFAAAFAEAIFLGLCRKLFIYAFNYGRNSGCDACKGNNSVQSLVIRSSLEKNRWPPISMRLPL